MTSCLRLRLSCHGATYRSDRSATDPSTVQTEISVATPRTHTVKQQPADATRTPGVATPEHSRCVRLPPISDILSASKRDPFSTACITDSSLADLEHLDHGLSFQSGGFSTMCKQHEVDMIRSDIMSHALNDPVARYSLIYAGASHRAYVRYFRSY